MDTKQKRRATPRAFNDRTQLMLCAIIALSLVFIIYLTISSFQRIHLRKDYIEARNQAGSCVEDQIALFLRTCDSLTLAGADIENELLPDLHTYFYAMQEMDDSLAYSFGPAYSLLSDGVRAQIHSSLSAYDNAYRTGKSTDSAFASLSDCMVSLNSVLSNRFTDSGEIRPSK